MHIELCFALCNVAWKGGSTSQLDLFPLVWIRDRVNPFWKCKIVNLSSPWWWAGNCACLFIPLHKTIRESHLPYFSLLNVLFRARECYGCTRDLCWESLKSVSNKCVQQTDNSYSMSRFVYKITPTPCPGLYTTTSTTESLITILICVMWKIVVIQEVSVQGIFQQFVSNILSNVMLKSSTVTSRTREKQ